MPQVQDFPPIAQRQIEAHHAGVPQPEQERGPLGLIRRLLPDSTVTPDGDVLAVRSVLPRP